MTVTLKNRLPAIMAELDPRLDVALGHGAEKIAAAAAARAPDAPPLGEGLVEAIDSIRERKHRYRVTTDWKAHFLEFGTVKMAPRPFLTPAFEESKDAILADLYGVLRTL